MEGNRGEQRSGGLPTGIMGNNAQNNGYLGLFKGGELLGFLSPQIMLNVGGKRSDY